MHLWRISNYADLHGVGGTKAAGRWHNRGAPIVYLAEHPALALLEVIVHFSCAAAQLPKNYQLLDIEYGADTNLFTGIAQLAPSALDDVWQNNVELTRSIGDQWLQSGSSLLLKVPSAILPRSYNYLFNPKHSLAGQAKIIDCLRYPFDQRFM
ncbi:MAG: RES family NAD+ phosphorylase [Marinagarivorans sp.]|nr:RES family NAD+ phosphorylase [Marinagarivorans sp.]